MVSGSPSGTIAVAARPTAPGGRDGRGVVLPAAGAPAAEVLGEVTLEGRFGIVLTRLDGPTLLQLLRTGAMASQQAGAILATLAISVHKTPPPPEDGLCHCDLHPGNVIMTADGPRLIDWLGMVRAPAALDLGACHILLSEIAPELVENPERPRALNVAVQSEYARLAGMSPAALTAAIEPYLPIVRVFALLGGVFPAQRERLIQRVEAALCSEDEQQAFDDRSALGA